MKARKAIANIKEIAALQFDAYGEDIHPAKQMSMIESVLKRYKKSQDADWEDRSAIQGMNPGLAELIKANKESQNAR